MTERSALFWLVLAHGIHLLLWTAGPAKAGCGYFEPLSDLTQEMRMVVTGRASPDTATARRIARHVRRIELDEVRRRLKGMNRSARYRDVERLTAFATEYSRQMRASDHAALARAIYNVEELFPLVCNRQLEDGPINSEKPASRRFHLKSILESDSAALKIALVLLVLFGTTGLLMALKYSFATALGLLHHNKICRIPAQIRGSDQIFPGFVTRAGLNGVRFEFDDDAVAKRLTGLMATPEFVHFDLWIEDQSWPVFVDGFHKFFSPLYFLMRLKRTELDAILARSTRAIRNAPEIGHKSTRKKWRAQIRQRKASIEKTRQARARGC